MRGMREMHAAESDVEYTPTMRPNDWVLEKFSSCLYDVVEMAVYSYYESSTSPRESKGVMRRKVEPILEQIPFCKRK